MPLNSSRFHQHYCFVGYINCGLCKEVATKSTFEIVPLVQTQVQIQEFVFHELVEPLHQEPSIVKDYPKNTIIMISVKRSWMKLLLGLGRSS